MQIDAIRALTDDELREQSKATYIKDGKSVETAKTRFKEGIKHSAKLMAVWKERYADRLSSRAIPAGTKWGKFHKDNTGEEPDAKVAQMANVFNELVKPGHITEQAFDAHSADALQHAASLLTTLENQCEGTGINPLETEAGKAMLQILNEPGDAAKRLKELKKNLKAPAAAEEPATFDFAAMLSACIAAVGMRTVMLEIGARTARLKGDAARDAYLAFIEAGEIVDAAHGDKASEWLKANVASRASDSPSIDVDATVVDPNAKPRELAETVGA